MKSDEFEIAAALQALLHLKRLKDKIGAAKAGDDEIAEYRRHHDAAWARADTAFARWLEGKEAKEFRR